MGRIFAMSDIHGYYDILHRRLEQLDNLQTVIPEGAEDKIIFLGDYIDEGPDSFRCLDLLRSIQKAAPERVIVLKGNHEQWLLEYLDGRECWMEPNTGFQTLTTFLSGEQVEQTTVLFQAGKVRDGYAFIRKCIRKSHKELLDWLRKLPLYYQTDTQIFVHAGVDEEAEDLWEWGTSEDIFLNQYPACTGSFYKDIIAGHVGTYSIAGDPNFHDIYYDGASHYYIDGTVHISGEIPVLVYEEETGKYYSLGKDVREGKKAPDINEYLIIIQ